MIEPFFFYYYNFRPYLGLFSFHGFSRCCALILETDIRAEDSEGVALQNPICIYGTCANVLATFK